MAQSLGSWRELLGLGSRARYARVHHFPTGHQPCTMKRGESRPTTDCEPAGGWKLDVLFHPQRNKILPPVGRCSSHAPGCRNDATPMHVSAGGIRCQLKGIFAV